jgi:hypothetical protein
MCWGMCRDGEEGRESHRDGRFCAVSARRGWFIRVTGLRFSTVMRLRVFASVRTYSV